MAEQRKISGTITVPIRHVIPDDLQLLFVNEAAMQWTANECVLSFFQTIHPLDLKSEDLQKLKSVDAQCVARLVVTPAFARALLKLIDDGLRETTKDDTTEQK